MFSSDRYPPVDQSLAWLIGGPNPPRSAWRGVLARAGAAARQHPLIVLVMLVALGVAVLAAILSGAAGSSTPARPARDTVLRRPPRIDAPFAPAALRPLTPGAAIAWNAKAPLSTGPNPAAAAFVAPLASGTDYAHSLECLTMAVYYEAGNEPDDGQRAVAQVVLNRMRHIAYPHSVCGVVFQGAQRRNACQFTFACDGALARVPSAVGWRRATLVAAAALGGYVYAPVGLATHYHADYVVPYWAASLDKVTAIGAHIFYRWSGAWGGRGAFTAAYAGAEPALPFLAGGALPPAVDRVAGPPAEVVAAERPVLVQGAAAPSGTAASRVAPGAANTVALRDRWIVPHAATAPAPVDPAERAILVNRDGSTN